MDFKKCMKISVCMWAERWCACVCWRGRQTGREIERSCRDIIIRKRGNESGQAEKFSVRLVMHFNLPLNLPSYYHDLFNVCLAFVDMVSSLHYGRTISHSSPFCDEPCTTLNVIQKIRYIALQHCFLDILRFLDNLLSF